MATQLANLDLAVETLVAQASTTDPAHAAQPGTGPAGTTCGDCLWSLWHKDDRGRRCLKCNLTDWDGREMTDIHFEDHSCKYCDARG